jgi:hypothetical protein
VCAPKTESNKWLRQEQALTIMALTYETLIDHLPRNAKRLEAALRRELRRYDLPIEAANLSQMRWHRMRKRPKQSSVALQEVARTLTEAEKEARENKWVQARCLWEVAECREQKK